MVNGQLYRFDTNGWDQKIPDGYVEIGQVESEIITEYPAKTSGVPRGGGISYFTGRRRAGRTPQPALPQRRTRGIG